MQQTNSTQKHYLDYYSEWLLALNNAAQLTDMREVYIKGDAFICILNELLDADMIRSELAAQYITEVNNLTWKKFIIFCN